MTIPKLCLLLLALLVASGCEKMEGDACSGNDCGTALVCLNAKCKKCEGSDRCKGYGMCAPSNGRCEVPAKREDDCKQPHGTEKYVPCEKDGKCAVQAGVCAATPEACTASKGCKENGSCTPTAGRCLPGKNEDCHGSRICLELGHCTVQNGQCALTSSADCARTAGCKAKGLCTKRDKVCIVGGEDDCLQSSMCKAHGNCVFRDGICQP